MLAMRLSVCFLFFYNFIFSQSDYPKDYFRPPLDIPMQLSGNFGELRPNHFHAGFDFKTLQKEGLKVYAVADGYVSRIKISTFGNGKTLYINHPNGFTSVYSHLQKTADSIQTYIKETHYEEQSFEMDWNLKPNELVVKKGQLIAFTGNTGASEGPHLHFEFRDTKTEKVINPLFFGFDAYLKDTKKPVVFSVYVYPIDNLTTVNQSKRPILVNLSLQKDGTYLSDKVMANGKIGFGISAFDYDDVSFNKNGIYKVKTYYNGKPNFGYQFDTYSFEDMRYINALIDYPRYKKTQQRVQKLFVKKPFALSIIETNQSDGILTVVPNLASVFRIEVIDFYGNICTVSIPIQFDNLSATVIDKEPIVSNYFVKAEKDNNFVKANWSVFFPAKTFYDDFELNFDLKNDILMLHEDTVPAHSNFTISVIDNKYSQSQKDKLFIATIKGEKRSYNTTYRKENEFYAKVKTLGQFALVLDTVAPTITMTKPIAGKWLSDKKTLEFSIKDDLSGLKSYDGYLNGKWILFEYDNKTKKIIHDFNDGIVAEGANDLKIVLIDNVGNSTIFEAHFFRSQINKI